MDRQQIEAQILTTKPDFAKVIFTAEAPLHMQRGALLLPDDHISRGELGAALANIHFFGEGKVEGERLLFTTPPRGMALWNVAERKQPPHLPKRYVIEGCHLMPVFTEGGGWLATGTDRTFSHFIDDAAPRREKVYAALRFKVRRHNDGCALWKSGVWGQKAPDDLVIRLAQKYNVSEQEAEEYLHATADDIAMAALWRHELTLDDVMDQLEIMVALTMRPGVIITFDRIDSFKVERRKAAITKAYRRRLWVLHGLDPRLFPESEAMTEAEAKAEANA